MPDYYEILGVTKDATGDDMKRAYRLKAREWHPDVNSSPEATERMKQINEAYENLHGQTAPTSSGTPAPPASEYDPDAPTTPGLFRAGYSVNQPRRPDYRTGEEEREATFENLVAELVGADNFDTVNSSGIEYDSDYDDDNNEEKILGTTIFVSDPDLTAKFEALVGDNTDHTLRVNKADGFRNIAKARGMVSEGEGGNFYSISKWFNADRWDWEGNLTDQALIEERESDKLEWWLESELLPQGLSPDLTGEPELGMDNEKGLYHWQVAFYFEDPEDWPKLEGVIKKTEASYDTDWIRKIHDNDLDEQDRQYFFDNDRGSDRVWDDDDPGDEPSLDPLPLEEPLNQDTAPPESPFRAKEIVNDERPPSSEGRQTSHFTDNMDQAIQPKLFDDDDDSGGFGRRKRGSL